MLAQEERTNIKGKKMALCWQCRAWFEAKQGLVVHKRKCQLPMPLLITEAITGTGDNADNPTSTSDPEMVRRSEEYFKANEPIYSDVSGFSDSDPSLFDLNCSFNSQGFPDGDELGDSDEEANQAN
jgi:hypothetical protein